MQTHATSEKTKSTSGVAMHKNKQQPFFAPLRVQPKLTIGAVDDPFEREADAMADRVMRMPALQNSTPNFTDKNTPFFSPKPISTLNVQCSSCEKEKLKRKEDKPEDEKNVVHRKEKSFDGGLNNIDNTVQRKCAHCEEEEKLQMKSESGASGGMEAPSIVHDVINSGGQPLDAGTRNFFEPRFGYDFSHVRIHTGSKAAESSHAINAHAYTHGNSVVFNDGKFAPHSDDGKRLLAHELTHVVQQKPFLINGRSQKILRQTGHLPSALEIFANATRVFPLTSRNWRQALSQPDKIIIIDFWDIYCRPCDSTARHMVSLADHYQATQTSGVQFYQIRLDLEINRELVQRYGRPSIPNTVFYYTNQGRPGRENGRIVPIEVAEENGSIVGASPEQEYNARIQDILHQHPNPSVIYRQNHQPLNFQDRSSSSESNAIDMSGVSNTLLINQSMVRIWMREAYRRSRMGGFLPIESLPVGVSDDLRRGLRQEERDGNYPVMREVGGLILRDSNENLYCIFHYGDVDRIDINPPNVHITNGNQIGSSTIVGRFHTHPAPPIPGHQLPREEPSQADLSISRLQIGSESYVVGVYNIYLIINGAYQRVGNTADLLFGGIQPVRPA